ncbi:MAG TPA: type III PLP-dependent enzyme [Frankiaceae bacterium]|jgi:ornithine decarboxylase|nr:type III PLP-dependent enzyme [Frankiaceae bacterium]
MDVTRRAALRHDLRAWARNVDLPELIRRHGTPLLVLQPERAAARYRALRSALPFVRFHYAIKALDHCAVLRAVHGAGGFFEVASRSELDSVQTVGSDLSTCLYTHPIKRASDIDDAYRRGVRTFVVDNAREIEKFIGRPDDIQLLLRLSFRNPEAKVDLSAKFGAEPADAVDLVAYAIENGVRVNGLSFHVGSQTNSTRPYRTAISHCLRLIDQIRLGLDHELEILDIGGGFPVAYRDGVCNADDIIESIRTLLAPHADRLTVLAEPGRYVVASCMTLITTVIGAGTRQAVPWYYLDDGVYGGYSNVAWEDVHPPILSLDELWEHPLSRVDPHSPALEPCVLAGPTCDSIDVIATDYPMPHLTIGDHLISPMMGAYTLVTSCGFNGLPPPAVVQARGRRIDTTGSLNGKITQINTLTCRP